MERPPSILTHPTSTRWRPRAGGYYEESKQIEGGRLAALLTPLGTWFHPSPQRLPNAPFQHTL